MASNTDFNHDHTQETSTITQQDIPTTTQQEIPAITHQDVAPTAHQPSMAPERSDKRRADSLFLSPDRETEQTGKDQSSKRVKTQQTRETNPLAGIKIDKDGKVAPYDAFKIEGRPRLAIYHHSFKETEMVIFQMCDNYLQVAAVVKAAGYRNDEIDRICEQLKRKYLHVKERYPAVAPVACLGPSGVGKSSTTNSIFHQIGAAYESDSPGRGTNLVHEFTAPSTYGTALFQVAAPYLRENQIRDLVTLHYGNVLEYLSLEEAEKSDDDSTQRKYDTAIEFFRVLLCDHEEFSDDQSTKDYLESVAEDDIDDVIEDLTRLIEDFKKTRNLRDHIELFEAHDTQELANIFTKVSRVPNSQAGRKPHPWPILSKVEIRHNNDLLNAGLIIADTPGMDDINRSVVEATRNYVMKAGRVLVFTRYERGAINEVLDANLSQCIALGKTHVTHLIVTKIDGRSMNSSEYQELNDDDRAELDEARRIVSDLKDEERALKRDSREAKQRRDLDVWDELESRLDEMPTKIAFAEARVEQVVVEIKCRDFAGQVKDKLRNLDRSRTAPDLPVHFISNREYQKHLTGYDASNRPTLDREGTGIPDLRRKLYQIPARGKATTLSRIGKTLLPSIFGSVIGILTKSRLERKNDVLKVITDILDHYPNVVDAAIAELKHKFDESVIQVFRDNQHRWTAKADKLVDEWATYKTQTFAAFCRRSGKWKPAKGEKKISWNGLIVNITADKVAEGFNQFEDDFLPIKIQTTTDVTDLFRKLETKLEECEDFQGVAGSKDFFKSIHHIRDTALQGADGAFHLLRQEVDAIRHACIFDKASYVEESMQLAYDECKKVTNTNPDPSPFKNGRRNYVKSTAGPRRIQLIREKLKGSMTDGQPSVFESVRDSAWNAFDKKLTEWEEQRCTPRLKKACDEVLQQFEQRFVVEEEIKQEGDKEAMAKLKEAAEAALDIIDGPLKKHITDFEDYEWESKL